METVGVAEHAEFAAIVRRLGDLGSGRTGMLIRSFN
jgi:hypothetical protein